MYAKFRKMYQIHGIWVNLIPILSGSNTIETIFNYWDTQWKHLNHVISHVIWHNGGNWNLIKCNFLPTWYALHFNRVTLDLEGLIYFIRRWAIYIYDEDMIWAKPSLKSLHLHRCSNVMAPELSFTNPNEGWYAVEPNKEYVEWGFQT